MSDHDRFWGKVALSEGCWEWTGSKIRNGYGNFAFAGGYVRTHRYSFQMFNGPIPAGLVVRHTCDNPPCVRPDHLVLGTTMDNARDRVSRGRASRGEGHPRAKLTDEQVNDIRDAYAAGGQSYAYLASRYGVSKGTIAHIVQGIVWKHLP